MSMKIPESGDGQDTVPSTVFGSSKSVQGFQPRRQCSQSAVPVTKLQDGNTISGCTPHGIAQQVLRTIFTFSSHGSSIQLARPSLHYNVTAEWRAWRRGKVTACPSKAPKLLYMANRDGCVAHTSGWVLRASTFRSTSQRKYNCKGETMHNTNVSLQSNEESLV